MNPTHMIKFSDGRSSIDVIEDDGALYTLEEWEGAQLADWEFCRDERGEVLVSFQGRTDHAAELWAYFRDSQGGIIVDKVMPF